MKAASAHHRTKEPDMAALGFGSGPLLYAPQASAVPELTAGLFPR